MDNWKEKYTPAQIERIERNMRGTPPEKCAGECWIAGVTVTVCYSCRHHFEEESTDNLGMEGY